MSNCQLGRHKSKYEHRFEAGAECGNIEKGPAVISARPADEFSRLIVGRLGGGPELQRHRHEAPFKVATGCYSRELFHSFLTTP
jgi:hypothetical protein